MHDKVLVQELVSTFQSDVNDDVHGAHEQICMTFALGLTPSPSHSLTHLPTHSSTQSLHTFCLQVVTLCQDTFSTRTDREICKSALSERGDKGWGHHWAGSVQAVQHTCAATVKTHMQPL